MTGHGAEYLEEALIVYSTFSILSSVERRSPGNDPGKCTAQPELYLKSPSALSPRMVKTRSYPVYAGHTCMLRMLG